MHDMVYARVEATVPPAATTTAFYLLGVDDPVDVCFRSFAMSSIFFCSFTSSRFSTACICCLISGCEFIMAINCACVTPCPC